MNDDHLLVLGQTKSGKSVLSNELHRRFHGYSIYFTPKTDRIWGEKVQHPSQLREAMKRSKKIHYNPHVGLDQDKILPHIQAIQRELFRLGEGAEREIWAQLLTDEVHVYSTEKVKDDPVAMVSTMGSEYGIRLVAISQYPTRLATQTRTNLNTRVVFRPGPEALRFLEGYKYPVDEVVEWTRNKWHYVLFDGDTVPIFREPIKRIPVPRPRGKSDR